VKLGCGAVVVVDLDPMAGRREDRGSGGTLRKPGCRFEGHRVAERAAIRQQDERLAPRRLAL
jgi:hypothetical protein